MPGVAWRNKKRAPWIRKRINVEDVFTTIKKKWTLVGHVMFIMDNEWTKKSDRVATKIYHKKSREAEKRVE